MPEAGGGVNSQGESSGIPGLLPRPRDFPPWSSPELNANLLLVAYQQRGIPKDISDWEKHTWYFKGTSYTKLTADQEKAITQLQYTQIQFCSSLTIQSKQRLPMLQLGKLKF